MNFLGFSLMTVGILLIGCVSMYYFVIRFLSGDAPVVLKIGIPTILIGLVILLCSVVIDRYRTAKTENFKEMDN